jgi:hypothetical protein
MRNTDFLNLSLPELTDKIDVNVINNDFKALEKNAEKHVIVQEITIDETAIIKGVIGPYLEIENMTEEIVEVDIADEILLLQKDDKRKIRTISAENVAVVASGRVKINYFTNAKHYVDENYYNKEKVDELIEGVDVEVDAELSETSENPVQNKIITAELASYATTAEVESKVTEKVAEIVAGAPEDFDTLKEMSDWLKEHEDSAATMNTAIQKNASDISATNTAIEKNKTDISTANTNIQKNVDDIATIKNDVTMNKTTLGIQCKNLLKPVTISQGETKGITITVNDDGTITTTGTATETFSINVGTANLKSGNYILNGCPSGGSNSTYRLDTFYNAASHHYDVGNSVKVDLSSDTNITVRLVIYPAAGEVNLTIAPMIVYADVLDRTYEPYQANVNTRISALETLSDVIYKTNESQFCNIDGYVLRVGNQAHLNLIATFKRDCAAWVGSIVKLPFKVKTPDNSNRYTIKQTQVDGRETSIYLQNAGITFFTSTEFKKGDVFTIPPMILDMYVEEIATTEGGE